MEKTTHEGEGEQGQLQAGWDELASETWLCIFDFLGSPRDLTCLACTCRQFAGLVLGTNLLWRALALHRRWPYVPYYPQMFLFSASFLLSHDSMQARGGPGVGQGHLPGRTHQARTVRT